MRHSITHRTELMDASENSVREATRPVDPVTYTDLERHDVLSSLFQLTVLEGVQVLTSCDQDPRIQTSSNLPLTVIRA